MRNKNSDSLFMRLQYVTVNGEKFPQDQEHAKDGWLWPLLFSTSKAWASTSEKVSNESHLDKTGGNVCKWRENTVEYVGKRK